MRQYVLKKNYDRYGYSKVERPRPQIFFWRKSPTSDNQLAVAVKQNVGLPWLQGQIGSRLKNVRLTSYIAKIGGFPEAAIPVRGLSVYQRLYSSFSTLKISFKWEICAKSNTYIFRAKSLRKLSSKGIFLSPEFWLGIAVISCQKNTNKLGSVEYGQLERWERSGQDELPEHMKKLDLELSAADRVDIWPQVAKIVIVWRLWTIFWKKKKKDRFDSQMHFWKKKDFQKTWDSSERMTYYIFNPL